MSVFVVVVLQPVYVLVFVRDNNYVLVFKVVHDISVCPRGFVTGSGVLVVVCNNRVSL